MLRSRSAADRADRRGAALVQGRVALAAICAVGGRVATAVALGGSSAIAAQHIGHYAKRAEINGRSVLAEMLAQPICSGSVSNKNETRFVELN